jgi:hypothetical protein
MKTCCMVSGSQLFARLVRECLRSGGPGGGYGEAEAVRWLSRLARTMLDRTRAVLAVEELQPSWLVHGWRRWAYVLLSRLLVGAAIGASAGAFLGLLTGNAPFALAVAGDGFVGGLGVALLDGLLLRRRSGAGRPQSRLAGATAYAALAGAAAGGAVLAVHLAAAQGFVVAPTVFHGLLFALVLVRPLEAVRLDRDVVAVEALTWSWARALRAWLGTGVLTWGLLVAGGLSGWWPARPVEGGALLATLPNSLLFAAMPALLLGLKPGVVEGKTRPNHGIWLSARNAALAGGLALAGCLASVGGGRLLAAAGWLGSVRLLRGGELAPGPLLLAAVTACFVPLAALRFGGLDVVKHYLLRLLLWQQGLCPLSFPRFLEHATARGLLRRAGGGYLFFHSTLMAYLAGAEEEVGGEC